MKKILLIITCAFAFLFIFNFSLKQAPTPESKSVAMSFTPEKAQAYQLGETTVLTKILSGNDKLPDGKINGAWVQSFYKFARTLMNIVLLIALLIFAFANILHINIETYAIKKLLPKLIVVAVAGNIAMPLIALASRMMDSFQSIQIFQPLSLGDGLMYILDGGSIGQKMGVLGIAALVASVVTGGLGGLSLVACGCVVGLGALIITLLFSIIMSFRLYVVLILAMVSPVAFALTLLPFTEPWFKRWWQSIFIPWFTMPLVVYPLLHLGQIIPTTMGNVGDGPVASIIGFFLPTLIRAGLMILAVRYPFTVEKDISSMIHGLGKLAGQGAQTLGGNIGDVLYKGNKTLAGRAGTAARGKVDKAMAMLDDPKNAKRIALRARREQDLVREMQADQTGDLAKKFGYDATTGDINPAKQDEYDREVDLRTNDFIRKRGQIAADQAANIAEYKFLNTPFSRAMLGVAGIASLPIGLQVAIKSKKEIGQEERTKTSQKVLGEGLTAIIPDKWKKALEEGDTSAAITGRKKRLNLNPFSTRYLRGFLGDLKYYERIAKDDLQGNRTPEAIMSYMGWDAFGKLRAAAKKKDPSLNDDQAAKVVKGDLDRLFNNAENVGTWANSTYVSESGLSGLRIAKLKAGYERLKQETIRELSQRGGRRAEADTRMLGLIEGGAGGAMHEEGEIVSHVEEGAGANTTQKADPATIKYLEQIAQQTKNNPNAMRDAILSAGQLGINETHAGQLSGAHDETLNRLTNYARLAGVDDKRMISLQRKRATEAGPEIGSIKAEIEGSPNLTAQQKSEAVASCDDLLAKKFAVAGASAHTADAQAIQIQSGPLSVKIQQAIQGGDTTIVQRLQEASHGLINGGGSPQQITDWTRTVGEHLPAAVGTVGPQGEKSYDLSLATIATFSKTLEAIGGTQ